MRRFLLAVLTALSLTLPAHAQTIDFDALPTLAVPQQMEIPAGERRLIWLQPDRPGAYGLSLSGPGGLVLHTFDTADGRPDGETNPRVVRSETSLFNPPTLSPLVLPSDVPYLLLVQAASEAVTLEMAAIDTFDAAEAMPESLPAGDMSALYQLDDKTSLTYPATAAPIRIEAVPEPRAKARNTFGKKALPPSGIFPMISEEGTTLTLYPWVEAGPPALVWLRVTPAPGYDEVEPNHSKEGTAAQAIDIAIPLRAALVAGTDRDAYTFTLDGARIVDMDVNATERWAGFTAKLERERPDGYWDMLSERDAAGGRIDLPGLSLDAGHHRLTLTRSDAEPRPVDYTLAFKDANAARSGFEREPNDSIAAAAPVAAPGTLRGTLAADDYDFLHFDITEGGRLWRLFGLRGVTRMILRDSYDTVIADLYDDPGRLSLDMLALTEGRHTLELRGAGDYALKIMDLGPAPADYEAEPNDTRYNAMRLGFDAPMRGAFSRVNDVDALAFRLDRESPVRITAKLPEDGSTKVWLTHDNLEWGEAWFEPGSNPYIYEATLPAGDYVLNLRGNAPLGRGVWRVTLERAGANPAGEPDHLPARLRAMPRNGDLAGTVGGFDGVDFLHVALPEGTGETVLSCFGVSEHPDPVWRVLTYGDDEQIAYGRGTPVVMPYDPALGGAVRVKIEGESRPADYRCLQRFAPAPIMDAVETPPEGALFAPGTAREGVFTDADSRPVLTFDLGTDTIGAYRCTMGGTAPPARSVRPSGIKLADEPLDGNITLFNRLGDDPATLTLRGDYTSEYPTPWRCEFWGADDMPTPAESGPPALFTALEIRASEDAVAPVAPPPQLRPGAPDWIPSVQPSGDAPIEIVVSGLDDPIAAYARTGQRIAAQVRVTNTGDTTVEALMEARMLAEGWQIDGASPPRTLDPGESVDLPLILTAPANLSPALEPALAITATVGEQIAATVTPIPLSLSAAVREPVTIWSAPASMRGGLNVLDIALGAKMIAVDGREAAKGDLRPYIHDGLAPHIGTRAAPGRDLTFRLAETAPLAGAMIQLRSAEARSNWVAGYAFETSMDGEAWMPRASGPLTASAAPQYIPFDAPIEASFIRLRMAGCRNDPDCARPVIQEVQAIATPDWRPDTPLDIARLDLGGHVVRSEIELGKGWNTGILLEDSRASRWYARKEKDPLSVDTVIAFHQNRAARIASIDWIGHEEDGARLAPIALSVSTDGPGGPWTDIGTLPPPPEGETLSTITLETPAWARYLRLTFTRPNEQRYGPDRIAIYEAQDGPSVLGLWEDDSPRAGFEHAGLAGEAAAVAPVGGPDAATAVDLPIGEAVASSILLERNEDWWRLVIPDGPPQSLTLDFGEGPHDFAWEMQTTEGTPVLLDDNAVLDPGTYLLRIRELPRNVVITWDTSGSVSHYIARTMEAVRLWSRSLEPGRDALQLLPFGAKSLVLPDWAETPEDVIPYLATLPETGSSDAEDAMRIASEALLKREGARGIVIITDAETGPRPKMWPPALEARPRVVALSVDSDERQNATIMMDWAAINGGRFHRVVGPMGLSDGLDMAAALFRAPKPYTLTARLEPYAEPEGETTLTIETVADAAPVGGAVQIILDASGSMLKRLDGTRRIAIAHDALAGLVRETLPPGAPLAFRAFGLEKDACRSELTIPLGPLDPDTAEAAIRSVPAINLAKTAIAKSLLAAREDLADAAPPRVVVLVTDGEETCDGDVDAALAALRADGFDARVNIVGFAIDDAGLAETFARWAQTGGGAYFGADDAAQLGAAVAEAVAPRFTVTREYRDGTEEEVGTLGIGDTLTVPFGTLRIDPAGAATGDPLKIDLRAPDPVMLRYENTNGLVLPEP